MQIVLLNDVKKPTKSYKNDIGLDLYLPSELTLDSLETNVMSLNLKVNIPKNHIGMLIPRSSIAKRGLIIQTSAIDPGYIGEIHLIITNCSKNQVILNKDERICSLIVYKTKQSKLNIVDKIKVKSDRGENKLGSSGK